MIKRILLVNSEFPPISGGGGVYTKNLAYGIAKKFPNITVMVLTGAADISDQPLEENPLPNLIIVRYRELYLLDEGMTHIWKASYILSQTIASFCPDVVHTHHTYEALMAYLCKQLYNFKLVITIQKSPVLNFSDWKEDPQWSLIRYCYERGQYEGVVCNSKAYLDMAKFLGASGDISMIYYSIDKKLYFKDNHLRKSFRDELKVKDDVSIVLCPSRIDSRKGIDVLIDSLDVIRSKNKKVFDKLHFVVAGANVHSNLNDFSEYLKNKIKTYKFENKIQLGYKDGSYKNMNGLYNASDIVVLPSIREGLGLSAIEAMCVHKPIVASNTIGIRELITDKENGLLFSVGNSNELADKLIELYNNNELKDKLANNAFSFQKNRFNENKFVDEHMKFYSRLFSSNITTTNNERVKISTR